MTIVVADARPRGLNVPFRPGNPLTVILNWPTGELTGRTFASTLAGVVLDLAVDGDVMTIEASETQTLAVLTTATWLLTETTGGGTVDLLVGAWAPSTEPGVADTIELTVTVGSVEVDVVVMSSSASVIAHNTATQVGDTQLHGVLEHHFDADGWSSFSSKVVNQDSAQVFTLSTSGDYGRVTSAAGSSASNQREILVHEGMTAVDGELTALIKGPSTLVSGNRPQAGLCLGYQLIDGYHVGYVVWYDIVLPNPRVWNVSGWRGNGGSTLNQAAGGQLTADIARDVKITSATRFNFLGWINELTCVPVHLYGMATGDSITVDSADSTFDATGVAIANAGRELGTIQYAEPDTTSAVSVKFDTGSVQLADLHKRFFPLAIKARRVGAQISVKVWRALYDPEPLDWQLQQTVTTDADFPTLPSGEVPFGLVVGHAHSGSYLEFGDLTFRRLA